MKPPRTPGSYMGASGLTPARAHPVLAPRAEGIEIYCMDTAPSPTFLALQAAVAGRYALERELGRGGMGVVYLARDLSLDRPVAIKLLPPALAQVPGLRERFLREARTAARLAHPNIVPIHAVEAAGELVYFVMGYIEGETLGQRLARTGPLAPDAASRILQEVAWALAYAHRHGVIHRDVKLDNILLDRLTGRALVSDFGIAQAVEGARSSPGEVLGTVRYMSPEQAAGEPLDGRSDLYSLGVTAFLALTGRPPFDLPASTAAQALVRREEAPPVASIRPDIPLRLAAVVDRCLAPDAAGRFATGEEVAEALGAAQSGVQVVPLPVERFVDLYRTLGAEVATYAAVLAVLGLEAVVLVAWQFSILPMILTYAFFVAVGLGILRFGQLVGRARRLLADGYGLRDVRAALRRPEEAPEEAPRAVTGIQPGWVARTPRWLKVIEVLGGAGLWAGALWWWSGTSRGAFVDPILFAILTLLPVTILRGLFARMLRPGRKGWWSRFWWRVMEWKVFKVAGAGRKAPPSVAADPTEIALGAGAMELFEALPREVRTGLGDIPGTIARLEQLAGALRTEPGAEAAGRRTTAIAALEQLRLDLLRARSTFSTRGDLTGGLDAARRAADDIERILSAHRELDSPTPAPGV